MTKRERVLATIRSYCANGREREAMRLYTEHRISYQAFMQAREEGLRMKPKGGWQ